MTASPELPTLPPTDLRPERPRDLGRALGRLVLATSWGLRHPREPFAERPAPAPSDRLYYRAEDGWESPLWRYPPRPGAPGEPVILAHGLGANRLCLDWGPGRSLARLLHEAGFDVYLLEHRGDPGSVPPPEGRGFDFDDIACLDLPAAISKVRARSGHPRVLWVGHGLGGQLLYAHLARGGISDIAGAVTICAPVRFLRPRSRARLLGLASRLLPEASRLPTRLLGQLLSTADAVPGPSLGLDLEGPLSRGLLLHGLDDLPTGLLAQVARWIESGSLCDRFDRIDYVEALRGLRLPLLGLAARGDPLCPPEAAWPALDALHPDRVERLELDQGWSHLDPLLGRQAPGAVLPRIRAFLDRWRKGCMVEARFGGGHDGPGV